ncbi:hypothetical protein F8A10_18040 [Paracoccus kondratievae]|uniref:hypothetical protein n=1 Tax=Paracoccus kondratievae TaxID=135740 RepID=UPI0012663DB2|nr:hypothetical protein [Paracoccus kondratievae]QFQ89267.1 hypothetical protein F8A10_18040 [Paracoccus kondratievae]
MVQPPDTLIDRLFFLTTSRSGPVMSDALLLPEPDWNIRRAGPRWYAIWSNDRARLQRLRVLLLPQDWSGLSSRQQMALIAEQLRPGTIPSALCLPLREGKSLLRSALSRRL